MGLSHMQRLAAALSINRFDGLLIAALPGG
jgi:hypothetical protein